MSEDDKARRQLTIRSPRYSRYEVGYGKPPAQHQFQKGQSGNPRGRPRGSKSRHPRLNEERMKTLIIEEAYRVIKVNDGNRQISVPMAQAILRSIAVTAAKGDQRAQHLFTALLGATERENKAHYDELLETAIEYKVEWEKELDRRARLGITGLPEPLPHPDHVIIDMDAGQVYFRGPKTKEEKVTWERFRERKAECDRTIAELEQEIRDDPDNDTNRFKRDEIESERQIRTMIARVIPD